MNIPKNNIASEEKTEGGLNFIFEQKEAFDGTLHLPGKEPVPWNFGRNFWAKKSVSLAELTQVWHEAAQKAKEKK